MIEQQNTQAGFSAVELLITLFIGVAFMATCYQLYAIVNNNGGDVRAQARASSVAYRYLQEYRSKATGPCTILTQYPAVPENTGLGNANITAKIECPYGTSSTVSRVEVSVRYGDPQEEVTHATYVSK